MTAINLLFHSKEAFAAADLPSASSHRLAALSMSTQNRRLSTAISPMNPTATTAATPSASLLMNAAIISRSSSNSLKPIGSVSAADSGVRLDRFIALNFRARPQLSTCTLGGSPKASQFESVPPSLLHRFIREKRFRIAAPYGQNVDGPVAASMRLPAGTVILADAKVQGVLVDVPRTTADAGCNVSAPAWLRDCIRYVDNDIVVISKPAGIASQPGEPSSPLSADVRQPRYKSAREKQMRSPAAHTPQLDLTGYLPALERMLASLPSVHSAALSPASSSVLAAHGDIIDQTPSVGSAASPLHSASRLRILHRLDRDVSGLMILARSRAASEALANGFKSGTIQKTYVGLVDADVLECNGNGVGNGHAPSDAVQIVPIAGPDADLPAGVGVDMKQFRGSCVTPVFKAEYARDGKVLESKTWDAETAFTGTVLRCPGACAGTGTVAAHTSQRHDQNAGRGAAAHNNANCAQQRRSACLTVLLLHPKTGRKHQLRQHVLAITRGRAGLIGDAKYEGKSSARFRDGTGSQNGIQSRTASSTFAPTNADRKVDSLQMDRGIALHAYKVLIPAGTIGRHQLTDMVVTDDALPPRMKAVLLNAGVPDAAVTHALKLTR